MAEPNPTFPPPEPRQTSTFTHTLLPSAALVALKKALTPTSTRKPRPKPLSTPWVQPTTPNTWSFTFSSPYELRVPYPLPTSTSRRKRIASPSQPSSQRASIPAQAQEVLEGAGAPVQVGPAKNVNPAVRRAWKHKIPRLVDRNWYFSHDLPKSKEKMRIIKLRGLDGIREDGVIVLSEISVAVLERGKLLERMLFSGYSDEGRKNWWDKVRRRVDVA